MHRHSTLWISCHCGVASNAPTMAKTLTEDEKEMEGSAVQVSCPACTLRVPPEDGSRSAFGPRGRVRLLCCLVEGEGGCGFARTSASSRCSAWPLQDEVWGCLVLAASSEVVWTGPPEA